MGRWDYSVTEFKEAVARATCVAEVARKLGQVTTGGSFRTIKKRIIELQLDISHFMLPAERMKALHLLAISQKKPPVEMFTENSRISRAAIKKHLIRHNMVPYECADCGLGPIWNGKNLVLQLDHKNGVPNDHRLENLALLCPNCHSQTSTFAGRQMAKNRWKNGQKVDRRRRGPGQTPRDKKFSREVAYQLYREYQNYSHVGRLLGVSANAIKKALKHFPMVGIV